MNEFRELRIFSKKVASLVEPKIKQILGISVGRKTKELLNYQIETGGKRLRPVLTVLSCLVCGGKMEKALYPAAGLEILHNCTLIYDDIIDNSYFRRRKPTTWAKFGKSIAECLGIDYSAAVFQAAGLSGSPVETCQLFAETMKTIVEGEILDILFEQSGRQSEKYIVKNRCKNISQKNYFEMTAKKTASLLKASCQAGAVAGLASKSEKQALVNYGFNVGIAFQIQDDILDIFGKEKDFGKKIGKDIIERKLGNIVIFYALQELPFAKRNKILTILRKKEIKDKEVREAVALIRETKAREKSALLGKKYIKKAKNYLKQLPQNKWNKLLAETADFIIIRNK